MINNKIKKLEDIIPIKGRAKYFYDIKLTAKEYICNMAVCKAQEAKDVWFIANNIYEPYAIREYKKRFDIEEMFKDKEQNRPLFSEETTKKILAHIAEENMQEE